MSGLPENIAAALDEQLEARRRALGNGAQHVGWKIAESIPGVEEHLGPSRGRVR